MQSVLLGGGCGSHPYGSIWQNAAEEEPSCPPIPGDNLDTQVKQYCANNPFTTLKVRVEGPGGELSGFFVEAINHTLQSRQSTSPPDLEGSLLPTSRICARSVH